MIMVIQIIIIIIFNYHNHNHLLSSPSPLYSPIFEMNSCNNSIKNYNDQNYYNYDYNNDDDETQKRPWQTLEMLELLLCYVGGFHGFKFKNNTIMSIFKVSNVQMLQRFNVPMLKCSNMQYSKVPMFKCSIVQMFKCSNI